MMFICIRHCQHHKLLFIQLSMMLFSSVLIVLSSLPKVYSSSGSSQQAQQLSLASVKNPRIPNLLPTKVKKVLHNVRQKGNEIRNYMDERGPLVNLSHGYNKLPGYERGCGIPVYMVTTPWGSPYMLSDKGRDYISSNSHVEETMGQNFLGDEEIDEEEGSMGNDDDESPASRRKKSSKYDKPTRPSRSIAPIFLDHQDALSLLTEMNQMGGFDVRITATNMARALRQASVLGRGIPTGSVGDNGNIEGYLRYKLVPSSRELYYASGCTNRQSVGFTSKEEEELLKSSSTSDRLSRKVMQTGRGSEGGGGGGGAPDKVYGPFVRWSTPFEMIGRKTSKEVVPKLKKGETSTTTTKKKSDPYGFLKDGRKGIPVFYMNGLELKRPTLLTNKEKDTSSKRSSVPLFLSYEDCARAWMDMNNNEKEMPSIEVYNYVDIITSIDKHQHQKHVTEKQQSKSLNWNDFVQRFKNKDSSLSSSSTIEDIVFVPSSKSVNYKEMILTRRGNCKARLRPMR